jgi:hypothetical protein
VTRARIEEIVCGQNPLLRRPGWMDLSPFKMLATEALEDLRARDASRYLGRASNEKSIDIVWRNRGILTSLGIFEVALVRAITGTRTNNHRDYPSLAKLIGRADRKMLRAAGDPLPGRGPWRLYRGVAGRGAARTVRGYFWTRHRGRAEWFANRDASLAHPEVVQTEVNTRQVLFYSNERNEDEFVLKLGSNHPVRGVLEGG